MYGIKNILMIILFCLSCCNIIVAKANCQQDSVRYMAAYNYIVNDSINQGKIIAVSDSIVDLDRYWFSGDIETYPKEKEMINQYRMNKKYIWFDTFYSQLLVSLFCKKGASNHVLFFSTIEDNILRADILPGKRETNLFDYNKIAFQTEGYIYLFLFNVDGTIKLAIQRKIIYD
jgi:hypothetical protein